jgi:hypothetical protein
MAPTNENRTPAGPKQTFSRKREGLEVWKREVVGKKDEEIVSHPA